MSHLEVSLVPLLKQSSPQVSQFRCHLCLRDSWMATHIKCYPPLHHSILYRLFDHKMSTIKALVVTEPGKEARVADVPMPHVRDDWIIVKTMAVALNPTDWKNFKSGYFDTGSIMGCDYAGVVEEVGKNVANVKKGDRVAGLCHGG